MKAMPEVAAAAPADRFGAGHAHAEIPTEVHGTVDRFGEAWPAGPRVELFLGAEQRRIAPGTTKRDLALRRMDVLSAEGALGALGAQDTVLLGGQPLPPLLVGPGHLPGGR